MRPAVPGQAQTQAPPPAPPPRPSPIDDGEIVIDSPLPTVIIPPITMPTVDIPPIEMPDCILDCPTD
jgi:hypothetical protein